MSKYDFDLDVNSRNSLSIVIDRIKPNSIILEFGPANGRMTKYLKEHMNCKVYAVELDKRAAQDASIYTEKIITGNIEDYIWLEQYSHISFDYIVFADVLEHLYNPEGVLKKSKTLLSKNGSILISLPNIAHNAIIIGLLDDLFTYRETGLLDNTHIRFFTKKSIDTFIEKCGLKIAYETGVYLTPKETEFHYSYSSVDENIANVLKAQEFGEVYQFIIEAKESAVEKVLDFHKKRKSILYIDTGKDFNELEKVVIDIVSEQLVFCFDISMFKNIYGIRFDPFEVGIEVIIRSITLDGADSLHLMAHNGTSVEENKIKFLHNDPQFIIRPINCNTLEKVIFSFESIELIDNLEQQQIKEKDQQIQEKEQQIQEKDQQIQEKNCSLQEKEQQLRKKEQQFQLQLQTKEQQLQQQHQQILQLHEIAESMRIKNRIKKLFQFRRK